MLSRNLLIGTLPSRVKISRTLHLLNSHLFLNKKINNISNLIANTLSLKYLQPIISITITFLPRLSSISKSQKSPKKRKELKKKTKKNRKNRKNKKKN